MSATFVARVAATTVSSTNNVTTAAFTTSGSNRAIAVCLSVGSASRVISSVSRGSGTFSDPGVSKHIAGQLCGVDMWGSSNEPETASLSMTITIDSAVTIWGVNVMVYSGVDQTTRFSGVVANSDTDASDGLTDLTVASGSSSNLVQDFFCVRDDTSTVTVDGSQTDRGGFDVSSGANRMQAKCSTLPGTGGNVSMGWSGFGTASLITHMGFAVVSAGTAPSLTVPGAQTATLGSTKSITGFSFTDTESDVDTITASCETGATITFDLSSTSVTHGSTNGTNSVSLSGSNAELSTVLGRGIDMDRVEAWPTHEFVDTLTVTVIDATALQDSDTVSVTWTPPTSKYKVLTGTPSAIITALQALEWTPPTDATGLHNVRMISTTSEPLVDIDDFAISVVGVSPVLTVPGTRQAQYGVTKSISGVSVAHADSSTISVLLECPAAMTMAVSAGATGATVTGSGSNSVLIEDDNEADINTVLASLQVSRATPVAPVPSNLDPFSANTYTISSNLQVGDVVYTDRDYEFVTIPSNLLGAAWIKTPNDDKAEDDAATLEFDLNAPAWVYVTLDKRYLDTSAFPSWMEDWEFVTDEISNDAPGTVDYFLYRQSYPAGVDAVTLGGYDFGTLYSNYTVIILPIADIVSVTVTATDSNAAIDTATFDVSWSESGGEGGNELPLLHSTRSITDVIM